MNPKSKIFKNLLCKYRLRGKLGVEKWLEHPTFLKSVQGEDTWLRTLLAQNRERGSLQKNFYFFPVLFIKDTDRNILQLYWYLYPVHRYVL
jgi:hypothetical protein